MKKKIFLIIFVSMFLFSLTYASDQFIGFKHNMYYSCSDSLNAFDTSALSRVFMNLGMERIPRLNPSIKSGYQNKKLRWVFTYSEFKMNPQYLHPKLADLKLNCSYRDSLIIESFMVFVPDFKRIKTNTLNFLLSAYQQEINPEIKTDSSLFINMPEKNEAAVNRYNWISPAIAMNYLYQDNPFSSLNTGLQIGYYFMDAFGLAYLICGPIFGKNLRDKIGYPIGGMLFLAEIRWLAGMELKREVRRYNSIKNSPYKVPITVKFAGSK